MSEYQPGDELPDRRRHGYKDLEKKLEDHAARIEARFRRWLIVSLLAFSVIGLTSVVAIVGYGFVLKSQSAFSNRIQEQRSTAVHDACEQTNARNAKTSAALIKGSSQDLMTAKSEAARAEIRRRRDVTLALIDTLVPVENCEQKARDVVEGG